MSAHSVPDATPPGAAAMSPGEATPAPDRAAAEEFLRWLDPEAQGFTFQTVGEAPGTKRSPKTLHGALDWLWPTLRGHSAHGAAVYVTINRTDLKGRKKENVTSVRALFVDLDGAPLTNLTRLGIEPRACVATSPDKFHLYWRVEGVGLDEFTGLQKRLAALLGGDLAVSDLPRVMRLPGFCHQKRGLFMIEAAYSDAPAYSREQFIAALEAAEKERGITVEVPQKRNGHAPIFPPCCKPSCKAMSSFPIIYVPSQSLKEQASTTNSPRPTPSLTAVLRCAPCATSAVHCKSRFGSRPSAFLRSVKTASGLHHGRRHGCGSRAPVPQLPRML